MNKPVVLENGRTDQVTSRDRLNKPVVLREVLATHKELADRLTELERRMDKKDKEVMTLFEAIRRLMAPPPEKKKEPIGGIKGTAPFFTFGCR